MPFKKWNIAKENLPLAKLLAEECQLGELTASILVNRGYTSTEEVYSFLTDGEFQDPFLLPEMQKAVDRIQKAIDEEEKITIYGDYDCDGVTATVLLYTYLSSIGADVSYYIPERDTEGYGLNPQAVKKIAESDCKLLITVDNGISAITEAELVKELGMELVITDHHQPGQIIPQAVAVVNPHLKEYTEDFKEYSGVGVAFLLAAAMEGGDCDEALSYFGDFAAVGTIGDIVPLLGDNRKLVKEGLRLLKVTDNLGLRALMEAAGIHPENLNAQTVAFSLVPRINAAGRMGSASLAVRLFLSEEEEEAKLLAEKLDLLNKKRQEEELLVISQVEEMLSSQPALLQGRLLILKGEDWNHGIIGIVCSKLLERYGKPVLLMSSDGDFLKGSARSLGEFHIFKALSECAEFLSQFGGHKLAAGFSLRKDNFDAFCKALEAYAQTHFDLMPQYTYQVDKTLGLSDLQIDEVAALSFLEPFGAKNESPLFLLSGAKISQIKPLSGGKHQKLLLEYAGNTLTALWFGISSEQVFFEQSAKMDLLVTLSINEYNGSSSVVLKVKDIRPSGFLQEPFFAAKCYYEKMKRRETIPPAILARMIPARDEIALIYRFLKTNHGFQNETDILFCCLHNKDINFCKLNIVLDILYEAGLITFSPLKNYITLSKVEGKADLSSVPTMKWLTCQANVSQAL